MMPRKSKVMKRADKTSPLAQKSKKPDWTQPLQTTPSPAFPRFTLLPQELQNMIWQNAIDAIRPRVVDVREGTYIKTRRGSHLRKRQFTSPCPIPSALHACRNSRGLALKRWTLSFATDKDPARIFIDFSSDTLYFDEKFGSIKEFTDRVNQSDLKCIHKIAFDIERQMDKEYFEDDDDVSLLLRMDFPNLTHLVLPFENYDLDWELFWDNKTPPTPDSDKTAILFFEDYEDEIEWGPYDRDTFGEFQQHREIMELESPQATIRQLL